MSYSAEVLLSSARAALVSSGLPKDSWVLDEFQDDRPCLVLQGSEWVAGYFERGRFDVKFKESDSAAAVDQFISWVRCINASTQASSAATAEWLRRAGKKRP